MRKLLLPLMLVLVLIVPGAGAATAPRDPVPEQDRFYDVPSASVLAGVAPGDVLGSRSIPAKVYELPVPVDAWQVKYRTEDVRGRPTATVTTVLVPRATWKGPGARPLVSYQTAEDGVAGRCAPSYALRAGIRGGFTGSYSEIGLMALALAKGWAVTAPDYEGPESQFLVADVAAKGVLDGIRATHRFAAAGLAASPVGIWGYSGGSFASVTAAQLQPTYAPELHVTAVALGGLLADIRSVIDRFDGSFAGGALPMGLNGFMRAYPELDLVSALTPDGRTKVAAAADKCVFDSALTWPFHRMDQVMTGPRPLDAPRIAEMLRINSPLTRSGVPSAPVYWYHSPADEFASITRAREAFRRYCAGGAQVQRVEQALGEHFVEMVAGAPGAVEFLARRFAGAPVRDDCAGLLSGR